MIKIKVVIEGLDLAHMSSHDFTIMRDRLESLSKIPNLTLDDDTLSRILERR